MKRAPEGTRHLGLSTWAPHRASQPRQAGRQADLKVFLEYRFSNYGPVFGHCVQCALEPGAAHSTV